MTPLQKRVDELLAARGFTIRDTFSIRRGGARSPTGERYREQIIVAPVAEQADKVVEAILAQARKVDAKTLYWRIRPDSERGRVYIRYLVSDRPPKDAA